jgi:hypothetical protein
MNTEITIIDQITQIEAQSGATLEIDIVKLTSTANRAKLITKPETDEDFVEVVEIRKELAKGRKVVSDFFMSARKGFNDKASAIIEIQKDTLENFTPEEERMKAFEKVRKDEAIRVARLEVMPARMARLAAIGFEIDLGEDWMGTLEEYVETFEDADFEIMVVQVQGAKNEADRVALAEEKAAMEAEAQAKQDKLDADKAHADAVEKAREDERRLAVEALQVEKEKFEADRKQDVQNRIDAQNRARINELVNLGLHYDDEAQSYVKDDFNVALVELKMSTHEEWAVLMKKIGDEMNRRKVVADAAEKARIETEEKDKAEKARVATAADQKYQAWVAGLGEGEFKFITQEDGSVEAYKLMSTYAKN